MLGSEGAIARVVHRLETGLPTAMASIRARHHTDKGALPDIRQYLDHEPDQVGVDATPTIYVVDGPIRARDGGRRIQGGPQADGWRFTYTLRAFLIVRGNSYRDTQLRSRRTSLAIRETLIGVLDYPAAPSEPVDDDNSYLEVDPKTLHEDRSNVGVDLTGRSLQSSYVQCDWMSQEWITAYPQPTTTQLGVIEPGVGFLGR